MDDPSYARAAESIWKDWGGRLEGWTMLFELAMSHKQGRADRRFTPRELTAALYDRVHDGPEKMLERFQLMLPIFDRDAPAIPEAESLLLSLFTVYAFKLRDRLGDEERARTAALLRRSAIAADPQLREALFSPTSLAGFRQESWEADASSHHTADLGATVLVCDLLEQPRSDIGSGAPKPRGGE